VVRIDSSAIGTSHVRAAIEDFNRLGREAFLEHYHFGPANSIFLLHEGHRYDAKAIVGVANGYATGTFVTGGDDDYKADQARRVLRRLGMTIVNEPPQAVVRRTAEVRRVEPIPLEANIVERFDVRPSAQDPQERERREGRLVDAYAEYLRGLGHKVYRHSITVSDGLLLTDLFDDATGELVEAKSSATRDAVRLALGQILDYARYVEPVTIAILLPERPSDDLCALLRSTGVAVVWEDVHAFSREDPEDGSLRSALR
jgi:hypothetical protein